MSMRLYGCLLAACAAAHMLAGQQHYSSAGPSDPDVVLVFSCALPPSNVATLEARVLAAADPSNSSAYGRWLARAEVNALVAPPAAARVAVRAWATSSGASCADMATSLRCTGTVAQVNALLQTTVEAFRPLAAAAGSRLLHRVPPGAPVTLPQHIFGRELLFITGLFDFLPAPRSGARAPVQAVAPLELPPAGRSRSRRRRQRRRQRRRRLGGVHARRAQALLKSSSGSDTSGQQAPPVNDLVSIETLRRVYNFAGMAGSAATTTSVAEFNHASCYNASDVAIFALLNSLDSWSVAVHGPPPPVCNGGSNDGEAALDVEYLGGVARGVSQAYWADDLWMFDFTQNLMALDDDQLPRVFSISYGGEAEAAQCGLSSTINFAGALPEDAASEVELADEIASFPAACSSAAYVRATNAAFAALTARGVTFVAASGDGGAHGQADSACATTRTQPAWPASSPWVTTVGATQLQGATSRGPFATSLCQQLELTEAWACATGGTEVVCSSGAGSSITSGGGFSDVAPQPPWQRDAVAAFFAAGGATPAGADFNARGRAYPDVAALGNNFFVWQSGLNVMDGTSISTPIWAAFIGLVNSARIAAGKSVVGFANPAIYKLAATAPGLFHDVTSGGNGCTMKQCHSGADACLPDCSDDGAACSPGCEDFCSGFGATEGWDPVTGWGTPNVKALIQAWVALGDEEPKSASFNAPSRLAGGRGRKVDSAAAAHPPRTSR